MFVYPRIGHFNVMLTAETIFKFIYECMGAVQACYILLSRGSNDSLGKFVKAGTLDVVHTVLKKNKSWKLLMTYNQKLEMEDLWRGENIIVQINSPV